MELPGEMGGYEHDGQYRPHSRALSLRDTTSHAVDDDAEDASGGFIMTRGSRNSTRTRVTPVFEQLVRLDAAMWWPRLMALPERPGTTTTRTATPPLVGPVLFGDREKVLAPPTELLRYLIRHPERLCRPPPHGTTSATSRAKRDELLSDQPERVQAEALLLLENGVRSGWHVLEGASKPDVFIETDDAVVVIEGKRTEPDATTTTTWMEGRDQMLRHIDCAWEIRGNRRVYGFFIVESDGIADVPSHWQGVCTSTIVDQTLRDSLPHRSEAERLAIASAFLGATTWSRVRTAFGLPAFTEPA
jgi:hypothetical protein